MDSKVNDFKRELKELLAKYNASIGFTCSNSSDTHALYDDHIVVEIDDKPVIETEGWWLTKHDIEL